MSRAQERTLLARLEAARQVYNACLGEAGRRARLVRESKAFQRARTLPRDDPARKALFAQARAQHACSEYALHAYAQQFGSSWLGEHLDSLTIQKLASRAYRAANRLLVGKARRVRFKGKHQLDTVEGKTNTSGLRWCGDRVEWKGLVLPARLDPRDPVQAHGLACPVKYVRLVRRKLGERNRFYAQLVCQGTPYQKPQHQLGSGIVGLDLGPSAIAVVSEQAALLQPFCPEVAPDAKALRRLDRQLDRQRRANNPANYDERGRVKRGKKRWKVSKRQRQVLARRREVHRKLAATRKRSHGQLAHRVLALGSTFQLEQLSYRAWQTDLREVGPALCARDVCRAVVSPGCECWRDHRLDQCLAGTVLPNVPLWPDQEESALPALACLPLWRQCPARSLLGLSGPLRRSRDVPARRGSGPSGLAGVGAHPCRRRMSRPSKTNPACGRRLPAAFGRPPADPSQSGSAARRVAQSILSSAEV